MANSPGPSAALAEGVASSASARGEYLRCCQSPRPRPRASSIFDLSRVCRGVGAGAAARHHQSRRQQTLANHGRLDALRLHGIIGWRGEAPFMLALTRLVKRRR